jgi:hypothetical protein
MPAHGTEVGSESHRRVEAGSGVAGLVGATALRPRNSIAARNSVAVAQQRCGRAAGRPQWAELTGYCQLT